MIKDIVFEELYASKVKYMVETAYKQGQLSATQILFSMMEEFEKKNMPITIVGIKGYIESLKTTPTPVDLVIKKAEETIKKAEETLPTPNNVINLFGRKK
jgi:hypothetical protein